MEVVHSATRGFLGCKNFAFRALHSGYHGLRGSTQFALLPSVHSYGYLSELLVVLVALRVLVANKCRTCSGKEYWSKGLFSNLGLLNLSPNQRWLWSTARKLTAIMFGGLSTGELVMYLPGRYNRQ